MWSFTYRLVLILVLCGFAIWSGRYAISAYYYERAKSSYDAIDLDSLEYASDLLPFINDVDEALRWREQYADALDLKGDLLYQSWWLSPDGQYLEQSTLLQTAAMLHERALLIRQNWSFSVARLALIYSNQKKLGDEFSLWFSEAHRLGLNETRVAYSMMQIGLHHWPVLSGQQRQQTTDFTRISIEQKANSTKVIRALLSGYGQLDFMCSELPVTKRMQEVCTNRTATETK
ncbi:hypothetical protein DFR28_101327 [Arenicella xantha]|uniref:Uncharacterized protein n=2 Tax=Arenicella xantha TaxID=644221 RepID=A0A395JNQ4_9GAMM|nr:hypothetical protein DFR28_101327 [Arenicella xantha]